jgi:hypothetical protein
MTVTIDIESYKSTINAVREAAEAMKCKDCAGKDSCNIGRAGICITMNLYALADKIREAAKEARAYAQGYGDLFGEGEVT